MAYATKGFDDQVERLLKGGGVGFMPTDTIYGLSAAALDRKAVEKLYALKKRSVGSPFIILFSDIKMLNKLSIDDSQVVEARKYWPGSLSLICEAPRAPKWLHQGLDSLAVRMPDHQQLLDLIRRVGPIISTSANPAGQKPAVNIQEANDYFGDSLDFYIDAGNISGTPSTIARLINGKLEVIRAGSLKIKED